MDTENRKEDRAIILVGNGTSILDKENGELIDSFSTVVRFNSFKIKGYEKHTGKKTDIWMTVNLHHQNSINDFKKVIFHSWADETCKLYTKLKEKRPDVWKIDKKWVKATSLTTPSTGLIAILYFLDKYQTIYLTGFDWWYRTEHHYGDNELRGTAHKPTEEYDLIKSLGNKIKFI